VNLHGLYLVVNNAGVICLHLGNHVFQALDSEDGEIEEADRGDDGKANVFDSFNRESIPGGVALGDSSRFHIKSQQK